MNTLFHFQNVITSTQSMHISGELLEVFPLRYDICSSKLASKALKDQQRNDSSSGVAKLHGRRDHLPPSVSSARLLHYIIYTLHKKCAICGYQSFCLSQTSLSEPTFKSFVSKIFRNVKPNVSVNFEIKTS